MRQLITPDGELIGTRRSVIGQAAGSSVATEALPRFLVTNLGYAAIAFERRAVAIHIAPARLKLAAFLRLSRLLSELPPQRIALAWHRSGWVFEIHAGARSALKRISDLMTTEVNSGGSEKYRVHTRPLETLRKDHPFNDLLDAWRETSGRLPTEERSTLLQGRLKGRFAIVSENQSTGKLHFQKLGAGLKMYHAGWTSRFVGAPVEDQPDVVYGRAVANCWRAALSARAPQLADVDAMVFDPKLRLAMRRRYARLVLQVASPEGRQLLSATCLEPRIDLGLKVEKELE
jgi:hypothetical protein